MKCIQAMNAFIINENEDSLIHATPVAIFAKDPLIRYKKKMGGPTMALESVHGEGDEKEEEETPITRHS